MPLQRTWFDGGLQGLGILGFRIEGLEGFRMHELVRIDGLEFRVQGFADFRVQGNSEFRIL